MILVPMELIVRMKTLFISILFVAPYDENGNIINNPGSKDAFWVYRTIHFYC